MRAVRYHGREDVRVDEVSEPVCGSGQVKVCQGIKTLGVDKSFSLSPFKDQTSIRWNLWQRYVTAYVLTLWPFI